MSEQKEKKKSFEDIVLKKNILPAHVAGLYYGFSPIETPSINPSDVHIGKKISEGDIVVDCESHESGLWAHSEEKIALLRTYEEYNGIREPQPVMVSYKRPLHGDRRKTGPKELLHGFEILGTSKSIAEAILIKTALAVLTDAKVENLRVEINSIGDKDSLARFGRELTAFYKKHIHAIPTACREAFKRDPFSILGCIEHDKCKELALESPKSINFLSESSRTHFREVLEFIEALEIPYSINNALVANRDYCNETVFEIRGEEKGKKPYAIGIRYNALAKKMGAKREIYAAGVSVAYPSAKKAPAISKKRLTKLTEPNICFMQLGYEAKLKSLKVIETLRQSGIALSHSLARDKMAGQISFAEKAAAPFSLIMGKKESMEDSVIVRNNSTRGQETVFIKDLVSYLKRHKMN